MAKSVAEIQYEVTMEDHFHFAIINNLLHIEYEDVTGRLYWWDLKKYDEESSGYEEDAYIFFEYLYINYKSLDIPNFMWRLFDSEIQFQVDIDIECKLKYTEDENLLEVLLERNKESLLLLQDNLSGTDHKKCQKVLTLITYILENNLEKKKKIFMSSLV